MATNSEMHLASVALLEKLPAKDRKQVRRCIAKLRTLLDEYGSHGMLALAIVGTERAAAVDGVFRAYSAAAQHESDAEP